MGFQIKTRKKTEGKTGDSLSLACGESVYGAYDTIMRLLDADYMSDVTIGAVAEFLQGSKQLAELVNTKGEHQPLVWHVTPGKNVSATLAHRLTDPSEIVTAYRQKLADAESALQTVIEWQDKRIQETGAVAKVKK